MCVIAYKNFNIVRLCIRFDKLLIHIHTGDKTWLINKVITFRSRHMYDRTRLYVSVKFQVTLDAPF